MVYRGKYGNVSWKWLCSIRQNPIICLERDFACLEKMSSNSKLSDFIWFILWVKCLFCGFSTLIRGSQRNVLVFSLTLCFIPAYVSKYSKLEKSSMALRNCQWFIPPGISEFFVCWIVYSYDMTEKVIYIHRHNVNYFLSGHLDPVCFCFCL